METHLGALGDADAYQNGNWTVVNANGQPYADINAWEFPSTYPTLSFGRMQYERMGLHLRPAHGVPQPDPRLRGICIYRTGDLEQTRELASSDPAVKAGQLEIQAMQWLTRPGALLEKGK